jgi:phospholipid/cholesterol/gamma-HCH transport system substrate-binding protein
MEPRSGGGATGLRLQLRVGVFVLLTLGVLGALVYGFGRQTGLFERQYRLRAGFSQTGGLLQGAMVRLAGVPVGHVSAVRLPESDGMRVLVELTIARRVQRQIRTDSLARIETQGLLGDKIVEVTLGSAGTRMLDDGDELRSEEPLDTNRLARQGTELLQNLVQVSSDLRGAIARMGESTAGPDLVAALRALQAVVAEVEQGRGALGRLVYDRDLGNAVADLGGTLRRVGDAAERLDRLLGDPTIGSTVASAGPALVATREAAERLGRLLRQVEEGPGFLHALIYDEGQILRDLGRLLARAEALTAAVERGEGALGWLVRDQEAAQALRRVVQAADGLAGAVERARASDSLLAALLGDPALAADLRATARQFREVTGRLARGEGLLGRLTTPGSDRLAEDLTSALETIGRLAGDARLAETLADLRRAMASLRAVMDKVAAGEGTIGGLVVDPTVYENLAAFLEGAQRSLLLRALIRATTRPAPPGPPSEPIRP